MYKKALIMIFMTYVLTACGTGIGNSIPSSYSAYSDLAQELFLVYQNNNSRDCGAFDVSDSDNEIEAGRTCIKDALENCEEAKYLYLQVKADQTQFLSYVFVERVTAIACQMTVRTFSDEAENKIPDTEKTCETIEDGEIPELSCGILD